MRVKFTYSQEDSVDSNLRFLRRSKTFNSSRWQATIFLILFFWLAIYVIFIAFLHNPYLAAIEAVVITVTIAALYPTLHEHATRKRLRRFLKESYGDRNDFQCEVELTAHEIRISQDNTRSLYEWKSVEEIVVSADRVEIFRRAGLVVVRNRAFSSTEERERFIELARRYLRDARSGENQS